MENNIKTNFENHFIQKRIDFIIDYDFENDIENKDYFIKIIKKQEKTTNDFYNALIAELATRLQIKDSRLFDKYKKYLLSPNEWFFKLCILSYFRDTYELYKKDKKINYSFLKQILISKYDRLIVKNQVLIDLMIFYPKEKKMYIQMLLKNLSKTTDYRSFIRTFNNLMNYNLSKDFSNDDILKIIKITEDKNLGKAVTEKLLEFKDFIKE